MRVACEAVNGWYEIQNAIIMPRENPMLMHPMFDQMLMR